MREKPALFYSWDFAIHLLDNLDNRTLYLNNPCTEVCIIHFLPCEIMTQMTQCVKYKIYCT